MSSKENPKETDMDLTKASAPKAAYEQPKATTHTATNRQQVAAKLVQQTMHKPISLVAPRQEPKLEGELVILSEYHSFWYGGKKYTFESGKSQRVSSEIFKVLKKAGLIK
jgi:hypothetical protein